MFGIVRPCRHRLRCGLFGEWAAHLCGLCLTLRDLHGQSARLVTNYDGLLVSVLTEAQNPGVAPHRSAGPCALRRFRRADVLDASATGAQLAASISLVLAAGKIRDHVVDRDGAYARRVVAAGAGLAAGRWLAAGQRTGAAIGFDTAVLTDAITRQADLERIDRTGTHRGDRADRDRGERRVRPHGGALRPAGQRRAARRGRPALRPDRAPAGRGRGSRRRRGGRVVQPADRDAERISRRPVSICLDALGGLRSAVALLELERPALTESLLANEVGVAVDRVFKQILRDNGLASANWPPGPGGPGGPAPGGPGGPGGPNPGGPGGPYPGGPVSIPVALGLTQAAIGRPAPRMPTRSSPVSTTRCRATCSSQHRGSRATTPRQFRQQFSPPSGGECCFTCCEGTECCSGCCDACGACDCSC